MSRWKSIELSHLQSSVFNSFGNQNRANQILSTNSKNSNWRRNCLSTLAPKNYKQPTSPNKSIKNQMAVDMEYVNLINGGLIKSHTGQMVHIWMKVEESSSGGHFVSLFRNLWNFRLFVLFLLDSRNYNRQEDRHSQVRVAVESVGEWLGWSHRNFWWNRHQLLWGKHDFVIHSNWL